MTLLEVCGKRRAEERFAEAKFSWAVSIGDPASFPPPGFADVQSGLRLEFQDVDDETIAKGEADASPRPAHITRLIGFFSLLPEGPGIIHCTHGQSRSTAAALVYYALQHGPGRERDSMAALMTTATARIIMPNRRMVRFADKKLGRKGALLAAANERYQAELEKQPLLGIR